MRVALTATILLVSAAGLHAEIKVDRNVAYGPHERHVMDIYWNTEYTQAPIAFTIHGGGFKKGSKAFCGPDMQKLFLDKGCVVVSPNYRLLKKGSSLRIEDCEVDCAMAVAYMQANASKYGGDPKVEAYCHECTASIDRHIDERLAEGVAADDLSLIGVQLAAGLSDEQLRANVKLAISGGQNEPRDAIAGAIWALLTHPEQLQACLNGDATWLQVFEEYARWISPIGMSPRRIAQRYDYNGVTFEPEDRAFFMFSAGNRDADVFEDPDSFTITRDISASLSFGAGPHYCAGAWASRALIADVALPMFFEHFKDVQLDGDVPFGGWAFRGPLALPCRWG